MDLKIKISKKEALKRLSDNSNLVQLAREFEEMFRSEKFKNLNYEQKKIEVHYSKYALLMILLEGKKSFNKELDLLIKRYL